MDIYRIFKPVICISRVFCLAPFTAVEASGSTRYKLNTFWLLYGILGVCAFFFTISVFWIIVSINDATVFDTTSMVTLSATCMASGLTQALCLNNGKNVIRILDHVSVLDSEHSGARISYYRLYKVFNLHLLYRIISLVVPNVMWLAALNTNFGYFLPIVCYSAVYFVGDTVLLLSDTQFIHFVLLLKYRFSVLNHTVINLTVPSLYKTSLNHTITAPPADRAVNSSTSALSSIITQFKSTLRNVCRHYDSLCDISESVNRTYSFQILLSVAVASIELLFTAYSSSIEFSDPSSLQSYSSQQNLYMSVSVGLFAISSRLVLLVAVCNRASDEVRCVFMCVCMCVRVCACACVCVFINLYCTACSITRSNITC
jgi:hypothetical protein